MSPDNATALAIVVIAVLPGSMYTWGFERQVSAFGVTLADRVLRFIALSVIFHLVLGWLEFWLFRVLFVYGAFEAGQFAVVWVGLIAVVALPAGLGTVMGGLYATRSTRDGWRLIRRALDPAREDRLLGLVLGPTPAPRAWDHFFSERINAYLRVETVGGAAVAGLFADKSYAGGYPHETDLYLEECWSLNSDGSLDEALGYPVYLPAAQIARIEILDPWETENR